MQRYKAHNRRQPNLTNPYVRSRINQLQERPP
jgi:hypothetical protein